MKLLDDLLSTLPEGKVIDVLIGLHWTAIVVEAGGERRCGLASTLVGGHVHGKPDVPMAGELHTLPAPELAAMVRSDQPTQASIGMATINALLPPCPEFWVERNAEDAIADHGAGKTVALVGHFPFIPHLKPQVGELIVIERNPQPGELPEEAAPQVIPQADVVALTGMTLVNHTLDGLLELCSPGAFIVVLGPSTPLSPVMFEHGIDLLAGASVRRIDSVLTTIAQGANFRQVHRAGIQLVTMQSN